ncbi:SMI1/KNR4 family protein SUKH-1 [Actinomadura pelletieri DSM 43383]|uniref:SMI1/KNR4 family protein SUKH-1 n=1 Tax=Actinomadura pelletieri DSM 43383 TaxID=1120940 RepID=A0A495QRN5_9ACTN|nr:SMI1/KNR4 family protein [Actinomadura pelletieri]RKS76041.1 SMI1/KNR4 family protein SUKH-1 [Actinomadura pelletieri DSM 43383]
MTDEDELLRQVRAHAMEESDDTLSPATREEIEEAETLLGFSLPPLLARLYQEVGNGGFGPDSQLLPLIAAEGPTAVSTYHAEQKPHRWPSGVLPILDWGCAMYAAVDCTDPQAPVLLFEPNVVAGGNWSDAWFQDADTLSDWLRTWLSGEAWYMEEAMTDEDYSDPRPWPQAKQRLT